MPTHLHLLEQTTPLLLVHEFSTSVAFGTAPWLREISDDRWERRDTGLTETDGFVYSIYAGCFCSNSDAGPSITGNVYFAVRPV